MILISSLFLSFEISILFKNIVIIFNLFSKLTGVCFEELKNYFLFTKIPIFYNNIMDEFSKNF